MQIYVLMPVDKIKNVNIKERSHCAARIRMTSDYSEYFGTQNEYYIDWESRVEKVRGWRTSSYKYGRNSWFYTALNPQDVIKKKIIKEV